jgi:hypothetical protein
MGGAGRVHQRRAHGPEPDSPAAPGRRPHRSEPAAAAHGLRLARVEPYGIFILLGLMFLGVLGIFMWPLIDSLITLAALIFGMEHVELLAIIQIILN